MVGAEKIDIDDLRKILDRKNEKILELQKINAENQKNFVEQSEIQKILLEEDRDKQLVKKIGALQKKITDLERANYKKIDSKPENKKQLELMKGAIKKIKNLQASLEEKNKTIKELKEQTIDIREVTHLKSEILEKTNQLAKKEKEFAALESEFINFKEEFVSELKSLETNKVTDSDQAFKIKELMDKIKELEANIKKLNEEKISLKTKLKDNKRQIKDLKFLLKMKEDQVENMSEKIDDLLLETRNGKDVDEQVRLKMEIRVNELELTREQIIRAAALIGRELPDISKTNEIYELIDELLLISEDTHVAKINEWKKTLKKPASKLDEKKDKKPKKPVDVAKKLKEHEKEEELKEMLKEEDELRRLIRKEIPNISEIEAAILQDQLTGLDMEEITTRIEMYRITKELEE